MFKKSTTDRQISFFGNFSMNPDRKRADILNDPEAWHNQFFEHVVGAIDESCFKDIYHSRMGRSNAPIRILLGMMALKEGFGWSDAQLYEQVHFNIMVMKALGFENLSDEAPSISTYYLFKQSVYRHHVEHGRDLIREAFKTLTRTQAEFFGVDGEKVRMDSKLIGSNIVRCSRLRLIISCLREFWKSLSEPSRGKLDHDRRRVLDKLREKKPNQIVYPMSEDEKSRKLIELGDLLLHLQRLYDDSDSGEYHLVKRLLNEQYQMEDGEPMLKPGKEIAADSIQSPHDPDAAYRKKGSQAVRGNSVNMTETCNDKGLNLVVDVQVEKATRADNDFVPSALDNAADVVGPIDEAYMDGAYQSSDNVKYGKGNDIDMIFTGIQGSEGNFEFIKDPDNEMRILDRQAGYVVKAVEYKEGRYKIQLPSGRPRYFKPDEIESFHRRQAIKNMPPDVRNRRNNVEATIFQLSFHTRNNKTRYRGQFRNRIWAISRSIWINLVRIRNHVKDKARTPSPAAA